MVPVDDADALADGLIEVRHRATGERTDLQVDGAAARLVELLAAG